MQVVGSRVNNVCHKTVICAKHNASPIGRLDAITTKIAKIAWDVSCSFWRVKSEMNYQRQLVETAMISSTHTQLLQSIHRKGIIAIKHCLSKSRCVNIALTELQVQHDQTRNVDEWTGWETWLIDSEPKTHKVKIRIEETCNSKMMRATSLSEERPNDHAFAS